MKRIGIYGKSISDKNLPFLEKLVSSIREKKCRIIFHQNLRSYNQLFSAQKRKDILVMISLNPVDLLISFGDGTFLDTATMVKNSHPILGIVQVD